MYGFFLMVLLLLNLDRCWFVPKQFLCESMFHTLEENFYMVNSECWIHNNDRFCFETQHAQFLMLFTKHVFRTSQSLKSGNRGTEIWRSLNAKNQMPPWAKMKKNTQQPKSQPNQLQNCQAVKLLSKVWPKEGTLLSWWKKNDFLPSKWGKIQTWWFWINPAAGQAKKDLATGDFKEIGVSVNPKRFGFSKNTRVDVSSAENSIIQYRQDVNVVQQYPNSGITKLKIKNPPTLSGHCTNITVCPLLKLIFIVYAITAFNQPIRRWLFLIIEIPGTLNNEFLMDVCCNNGFTSKGSESSNWNNH